MKGQTVPYTYRQTSSAGEQKVSLPTWVEAQAQAVAHANAAAKAEDDASKTYLIQTAQAWATIALSEAAKENTSELHDSLRDVRRAL
jgi:hypothetical protein